jgi:hypothetical protein
MARASPGPRVVKLWRVPYPLNASGCDHIQFGIRQCEPPNGPGVQLVHAILQPTLGRLPLLWFRKIVGQGGLLDEGR